MAEFFVKSLSEIDTIAKKILTFSEQKVFILYGEMGVGKTTLIKAIGKQLETIDEVISPTFSIANVYQTKSGDKWYHLDMYRLKDASELLEIGIDDYISDEHYCFIEWPQLIETYLDKNYTKITITLGHNKERIITIQASLVL